MGLIQQWLQTHFAYRLRKTRAGWKQTGWRKEPKPAMQLEFHQLDRGLAHLRAHRPERQRRLLASLAASGQQMPIVVVAAAQQKDRYLVIDGYQRIQALQQLGRDTVEAVSWPMGEAEAVMLDRTLRFSARETAL